MPGATTFSGTSTSPTSTWTSNNSRVELGVRLANDPLVLDRMIGVLRRRGADVVGLRYSRGVHTSYACVEVVAPRERVQLVVEALRREVAVLAVDVSPVPAAPPAASTGRVDDATGDSR